MESAGRRLGQKRSKFAPDTKYPRKTVNETDCLTQALGLARGFTRLLNILQIFGQEIRD